MNNKLYDYFLSGYSYDEKNDGEFNYRFNMRYSMDKFNDEFNKFIYLLNSFYYDNNKIVTGFNSYDIIIPLRIIKHIIKLYNYAKDKNLIIHSYVLSDFLLTYHNTINLNKKENKKYNKVELQYKKILSEMIDIKWYNQLLNNVYAFYPTIIHYGINEEKYISPETAKKVLNNTKNDNIKNSIIEDFLKNDKYYLLVINYDKKVNVHKKYYLDFILRILSQEHGYDNITIILNKIVNNLDEVEIKSIINAYVEKTNSLCSKYKNKEEGFIESLYDIDHLKNSLSELANISKIDKSYTEKIHECIINILTLKRFLLSDNNYINSDMKEFSTTTTIPKKEEDAFVKGIMDNKFNIYGASSLDFDKSVEDAINHYSEFALQSTISHFSIDIKTQTYSTNDIFSSQCEHSFEKYYENIGKEYTINNQSKLMNKMSKGYYNEMLRYLFTTFNIRQNITISMLGEDNFNLIVKNLKDELGYSNSSDYETIVGNILAIEIIINKLLTKNGKKYSDNMVSNIDTLFELYIDNKKARNGFMYIYYSLYEHTGPRMRNRAMHGTLIGEPLSIPLLVSFSGLIFVSWLLNEE